MSISITKTISGDTPASVQMETLHRRDTGAAVVLSPALPQPFTAVGGGVYTFAFTDPAGDCPNGYNYSYQLDWSDGTYDGPYFDATRGTIAPAAGPLAVAASALAQLVANVPFFQTWTASANTAAALNHVFVGEVGYPIAAVTISGGVLTVRTRDVNRIGFGDVVTIEGASVGLQSGVSLDGKWTVTGTSANTFTAATTLPNLATVYPDQALALDTTRPLAVIGWDKDDLQFASIGVGGTTVVAGTLQILLEADTPPQYAQDPVNAPYDAASNYGQFFQGLNEAAGTGDLMILNDTKSISAPEFTAQIDQDDNTVRFERWRALIEVSWGLTG